jgi:hypothetical protein
MIKATLKSTPNIEREVTPPAKCFCCQDSGKVSNSYLGELVEIPEHGDIVPYICQRYDCGAGQAFLKAYEMSQEQRDIWYNNQVRESKGSGEGLPRPVSALEYRANFSTNLNRECCDWLHDRGYQNWLTMIRTPRPLKNAAIEFAVAVSDRQLLFKEIQQAIANLGRDITPNIEKFLNHCRDRDRIEYSSTEALPTNDYQVLLSKIKGLKAS